MTRAARSKVLESATDYVPGPGTYEVGEPIHDYRGVYKNMGKKKQKKTRTSQAVIEGIDDEQEEAPEKDSDGSEGDE